MSLPSSIKTEKQLDEFLTEPSEGLLNSLSRTSGDFMILGAGGKMGPSLSLMLQNALQKSGKAAKVYAVSRFSSSKVKTTLQNAGVQTLQGDLLDHAFLQSLPRVENIIFMAGMKFGSSQNQALTWALNVYLPALVAEIFRDSRIVVFSTGNVYPFVPVNSGGCDEKTPPDPIGEYAQSCLGRERMFEYGNKKYQTLVTTIRLNYAVELRYGVLVDIALKVKNGLAVELQTGYFNVIWQGDANAMALRALNLCDSPPFILNVTGPEILSVRRVAQHFGERFGKEPHFVGEEAKTALLNNAALSHSLFGYPRVSAGKMIEWVADWIDRNMPIFNKPTHFQVRNGKF